jgi:purine-binding chemotaxis protein CheW
MSGPQPETPAEAGRGAPQRPAPAYHSAPLDGARVVIFTLDGQEFALGLERIVEIIPYRNPTPVPGAGPAVEGILPWRGRMVTILRTRRRLGLTEPAGRSGGRVILLEDEGERIGLVVDAVVRVASVPPGERQPIPPSLGLARPNLFLGGYPRSQGYLLLVNDQALVDLEDERDPDTGRRS